MANRPRPEAGPSSVASPPSPRHSAPSRSEARVSGLRRIHCSTHKSLTKYFQKVINHLCQGSIGNPGRYKHFFSYSDEFYRECERFEFASINNHIIDLDRFDDVLVTRMIRDPRDLIVSAYYYHRRAGEPWCNIIDPTDEDLSVVAGAVPTLLPPGKSVSQYLQEVSLEEGLAFEFEFRRHHFQTMLDWPDDPRVRVFRYEDVIGDEVSVFNEAFLHFRLSPAERLRGLYYARKFRAARRLTRTAHIRNPAPGQWRALFSPGLKKQFDALYGPLVDKLGYPID